MASEASSREPEFSESFEMSLGGHARLYLWTERELRDVENRWESVSGTFQARLDQIMIALVSEGLESKAIKHPIANYLDIEVTGCNADTQSIEFAISLKGFELDQRFEMEEMPQIPAGTREFLESKGFVVTSNSLMELRGFVPFAALEVNPDLAVELPPEISSKVADGAGEVLENLGPPASS